MRILHAPYEIAGQLALLALGQRHLGHQAESYSAPHPFGYDPGPDIRPKPSANKLVRRTSLLAFALSAPFRYGVIHLHAGQSLLPEKLNGLDGRLVRAAGRKLVMQFWGSDARLPSLERARNRFYVNAYGENEDLNRKRLEQWADLTDGHAIAADHSFDIFLSPYFEHVHTVRQCVDTARLKPRYPVPDNKVPLVVHAPSNLAFKGTEHVRRAVSSLQDRGFSLHYVEITGGSHAASIDALSSADIVIDQLLVGSHGVMAAEAMSLGKPVFCYILPELLETYPVGFPIINVNPETLEDVLAEWLVSPELRLDNGKRARIYAEQFHDIRAVAAQAMAVYEQLP